MIATRCRNSSDADARIAARRLDQRCPRSNLALLLRLLNHCSRNAVLHRPRRVEILELHQQICRNIIRLCKVFCCEQRRMTDELRHRLINVSHNPFSFNNSN